MGKDRSTVTNYIRLLKLPPDIQIAVRNGEISMGHARALINVDTIEKQLYIFNEIKSKSLSVRQTENLVRNLYKEKEEKKPSEALPAALKKWKTSWLRILAQGKIAPQQRRQWCYLVRILLAGGDEQITGSNERDD
jgi:ParB-like chromosome segregation protein Spo0J